MTPSDPKVIPFPLTGEDRLRIATRRLAVALEAQAAAMARLRAALAPYASDAPDATDRVVN